MTVGYIDMVCGVSWLIGSSIRVMLVHWSPRVVYRVSSVYRVRLTEHRVAVEMVHWLHKSRPVSYQIMRPIDSCYRVIEVIWLVGYRMYRAARLVYRAIEVMRAAVLIHRVVEVWASVSDAHRVFENTQPVNYQIVFSMHRIIEETRVSVRRVHRVVGVEQLAG